MTETTTFLKHFQFSVRPVGLVPSSTLADARMLPGLRSPENTGEIEISPDSRHEDHSVHACDLTREGKGFEVARVLADIR